MKDYDKAMADFLYVAQDTTNQYTWWTKGSMYFEVAWLYWTRLNNAEQGIKYFNLTEENKGFSNNWRKGLLGSVHEWHKEYDKALAVYNQCIESDTKDESSIYDRGYIYKQLGEMDKANADFNTILELIAQDDEPSHDLYRLAGSAYLEMDMPDKARENFENCEETVKTDGTKNGVCACVYSTWAKYYKYTGEYETALENIKKAIELANSVRNNKLLVEIEGLVQM